MKTLDEVWYDADIIEKIVTNLLSNAFKYSPVNGICSFTVKKNVDRILLSIENTALNGSNLQLDKLFTRFYQYDEHSDGMGVGLSLVKEIVKVYGGHIAVSLEQNHILHFGLDLPVGKAAFPEEMISEFKEPPKVHTKDLVLKEANKEPSGNYQCY